jgi:hypothetical protein
VKEGTPINHPHDALEYRILLMQARKAIPDLEKPSR